MAEHIGQLATDTSRARAHLNGPGGTSNCSGSRSNRRSQLAFSTDPDDPFRSKRHPATAPCGSLGSHRCTLRLISAWPRVKHDTRTSADAGRRRQMKSTNNAPWGQPVRKNQYSMGATTGDHKSDGDRPLPEPRLRAAG